MITVPAPTAPDSVRQRQWLSPLRYPGGKARMAGYLGDMFLSQSGMMDIEIWIEPFAGGAGAGLALLAADVVSAIWLIERNPALAAFWRYASSDPTSFACRVEQLTTPTLSDWHSARDVVADADAGGHVDDETLGFAAFVINRCSRSGIIAPNVGPMGGQAQTGRWRVDSRWNGPALADRFRRLATFGSGIRVIEADAIDYISGLSDSGFGDEVMLLCDPPYVCDGPRLYRHSFTTADHLSLAMTLRASSVRWALTYDANPLVLHLYDGLRILEYTIRHSSNRSHRDTEYAIFSDNLQVDPDAIPLDGGQARRLRW